jgi:CubicO group peptidase (beta-lactamase class C family)
MAVVLSEFPPPAIPQSVAAPTLAERLDRLAAEFDRNRIEFHVPGAVLAVVRGFGVADIEKTPVTPDTPFLIASATKAFTATLGMLLDEGRTIFQVECVEVGVELAPDTFALRPSTASGRGK